MLAGHAFQQSPLWDALTLGLGAVGGWFGVTAIPHLWLMARSGVRQDRLQLTELLSAVAALAITQSEHIAESASSGIDIFAREADVYFRQKDGHWTVQLQGFALTNRSRTNRVTARVAFEVVGIDRQTTSHFLNETDMNDGPFSGDLVVLEPEQSHSAWVVVSWRGPRIDCEDGGSLWVTVTDTLTGRETARSFVPTWHIEGSPE